MSAMLPAIAVIAAARARDRRQLAETVMFSMVPGPAAQRVALTAVAAETQIRQAERNEEALVNEAVDALEAAKNAQQGLSEQDLARFPRLVRALDRLPADVRARQRTRILRPPPGQGGQGGQGGGQGGGGGQ